MATITCFCNSRITFGQLLEALHADFPNLKAFSFGAQPCSHEGKDVFSLNSVCLQFNRKVKNGIIVDKYEMEWDEADHFQSWIIENFADYADINNLENIIVPKEFAFMREDDWVEISIANDYPHYESVSKKTKK